jgi:hypothetical protein
VKLIGPKRLYARRLGALASETIAGTLRSSPIKKRLAHVTAIAEFERELNRERAEGRKRAMAKGWIGP